MSIKIQHIFIFVLIVGLIVSLFFTLSLYEVLGIASVIILAFAVKHRKNKSKVRWQKHTDKRAGQTYNTVQNKKKGDKIKNIKKLQTLIKKEMIIRIKKQ